MNHEPLIDEDQIVQNNNKKNKFLGFHAAVLVKTFLLMHHYYYCRTDIDEVRVFSFLRVGRTDRQSRFRNPHNYGNMSTHKKFQLKINY